MVVVVTAAGEGDEDKTEGNLVGKLRVVFRPVYVPKTSNQANIEEEISLLLLLCYAVLCRKTVL